jgi:ArsR family transcriptional regulator
MDDAVAGSTTLRPEVLRVLSDPVALQAITVLSRESLCTCHLADAEDRDLPVAERLGELTEAGLVQAELHGDDLYYRLRPGALDGLSPVLTWVDTTGDPTPRPCC